MREFTDEESNFAALLQRAMDLEGVDRDVVYQLVALLMKVTLEISNPEDRNGCCTDTHVVDSDTLFFEDKSQWILMICLGEAHF